jgi:LAO/AO transport system kinase
MISTQEIIDGVLAGDQRALARAITIIENRRPEARVIQSELYKSESRAHIVGITGSPGSGKSTLVDQLICEFTNRKQKVAVIAVDPSSPFSGGAVLGDRIRMQAALEKTNVFIRSVASRGALGGLSHTTIDILYLFAAAKYDVVIIETVGVGQAEIDIVRAADTCAVVLVPGMGDSVQALKAGVMEIADVFIINKADKDGASHLHKDISVLLSLDPVKTDQWDIPIVKTIAPKNEGVIELTDRLIAHNQWLQLSPLGAQRKKRNMESHLLALLDSQIKDLVNLRKAEIFDPLVVDCLSRKTDPFSAADLLFKELIKCS